VLIPEKYSRLLCAGLAAAVLCMAGCGGGRPPLNSGNFAGVAATRTVAADGAPTRALHQLTLSPASITAGASTALTVELAQPAPAGGATVQLQSSNSSIANVPTTLSIPAGATSGTVTISTSAVSAAATVSFTALSGDNVAGASLKVQPETPSPVTVTLQPSALTVEAGHSGSFTVKTTVTSGFAHSLALSAPLPPHGYKISFSPTTIAAPGGGSSSTTISVGPGVTHGGYQYIHVTASEGTVSASAILTLKVTEPDPGAGASFQGCWYSTGGHKYQGVQVSVANPGTYPFDGDLYYGTNCNPNTQADEIGFGTPISFGGFDWIFYFNAFADQNDMSTLWHVGNNTSQCVNYEVAPACQ
jgi:hypothetical protein